MARRSTHNPRSFTHVDEASASRGPTFDLFSSGVRQRAAQWSGVGEMLAASVATPPEQHAPAEVQARPGRAFPAGQEQQSNAKSGHNRRNGANGANGSPSANSSNESWQLRQIELLARIDENIRRMRELQEAARSPQSTFTEPAY